MTSPRSSKPARFLAPARGSRQGILCAMLMGVALSASPQPAQAIDIVTWNIARYPNSHLAFQQPHFRRIIENLNPDILVVQELNAPSGRDSLLDNVLNVVHPGEWDASAFVELSFQEGGAVFYKTAKVSIFNVLALDTGGPRDVLLAGIRPVGYGAATFFRVYSHHWKAGSGSSDLATRALESANLRNHLNTVPASQPFIVGGDYNMKNSSEDGFQRLVESQADNDGRCTDPLNLLGSWTANTAAMRPWQSQSPCQLGCLSGFTGGGMDDRFDLWLHSSTMGDGEGFDYIPGSYVVYGQDGEHYNDDIDGGGFNNAVPLLVASSLRFAADHLPVKISIQVPAKVSVASQLDIGQAIEGGFAFGILPISNGAVPPGDELNYSVSASAGFGGDLGSFIASTTSGANDHLISMDTAATGVKNGTLTISSDDPDSSFKQVLLSGVVLRHSDASLDSLVSLTTDTIDLGEHFPGEFETGSVRAHNLGYDALQALLSVDSAVITGGGGRFSLVDGAAPVLLGSTGETYRVSFDDAGATADSVYQATLTLEVSDETLPGAVSHTALTVSWIAKPLVDPTAVPVEAPSALRFYAPRPNPMTRETYVRFDLPEPTPVRIAVYDLSGRRVRTLARGVHSAGSHQLRWGGDHASGTKLPAGIYLIRFDSPKLKRTHRVALLP